MEHSEGFRIENENPMGAAVRAQFSILDSSADDFQRDLGRYWRHVRKLGGIAVTQQGWIYKSHFKSLAAVLNVSNVSADEHDNPRLWFIRRLLQAMKELVAEDHGRRLIANLDGRLLGMPMAQRVRWTFETWRDSGAWHELLNLSLPTAGGDPHCDAPAASLGKARLALLRAIGRLAFANRQPGEWVALAELVAYVKHHDYTFLFERQRPSAHGGLYTSPYYGANNPYRLTFPSVKNEVNGWDAVEGAFVAHVLAGPLHWMGLAELGYAHGADDATAAPTAFRLTPAGAWLIGGGEQPQFVESGGKVIVQPNFTVLALEPISDAVLNDLDHFAESKGGERVLVYHLARESLYRGQQSGWNAARVIAFLEAHQGAAIPANVRRSLEEWEAAHRRITFHRNVCVVQFADAEAEQELVGGALQPFEPQTIGAHFKLIEQHDAAKVVAALREAEWMPVLQPAGEQSVEGALRVDDEGKVTFVQATPSVYALGRLAWFADPSFSGDGGKSWMITAASVRAAMIRGMSLDQLLATLAELHVGPIPVALEEKIRTWASFFGDATLQPVTLLELSNHDVLTNLLNDREVGPYLTPIEGRAAPLAIVQPAYVETVRAMLRERGINI